MGYLCRVGTRSRGHVLFARWVEGSGKNHHEIAQVLGVTRATVQRLLHGRSRGDGVAWDTPTAQVIRAVEKATALERVAGSWAGEPIELADWLMDEEEAATEHP